MKAVGWTACVVFDCFALVATAMDVCANTLKGCQVKMEDLYDVSEEAIVPSGVAALDHLQAQGYAYIKPWQGRPGSANPDRRS